MIRMIQESTKKVAFISSYMPRRCGIATFTSDLINNMKLAGGEDAIKRYKMRIEQAEQLKEFALAQQLRNILAVEQEHAMDLIQALGK